MNGYTKKLSQTSRKGQIDSQPSLEIELWQLLDLFDRAGSLKKGVSKPKRRKCNNEILNHNKFAGKEIDKEDCKAIKDAYDLISMAAAAKGCDFTRTGKHKFGNQFQKQMHL